jgi:hypothetical protein
VCDAVRCHSDRGVELVALEAFEPLLARVALPVPILLLSESFDRLSRAKPNICSFNKKEAVQFCACSAHFGRCGFLLALASMYLPHLGQLLFPIKGAHCLTVRSDTGPCSPQCCFATSAARCIVVL